MAGCLTAICTAPEPVHLGIALPHVTVSHGRTLGKSGKEILPFKGRILGTDPSSRWAAICYQCVGTIPVTAV